jgi:hypothetical protein
MYLPIAFRRGLSHEDRERTREMRNERQREDNKACVFYSSSVETMKEGMGRWTVALPHRHQAPPPFASSPRPFPFPPGGPAQTPHSARLDRSGPASCITGGEEVQYRLTARKVVPEFKPAVSPPGLIPKLRPQLPLFNPSPRAVVERDCHNESAVLSRHRHRRSEGSVGLTGRTPRRASLLRKVLFRKVLFVSACLCLDARRCSGRFCSESFVQ